MAARFMGVSLRRLWASLARSGADGQGAGRRRGHSIPAATALLALALVACDGDSAVDRLAAGERGQVVQVRSGDVLVLDTGLVVRLAQIETPYADQPGAAQAQADLHRLVGGQLVQLLYGGARRDAYGRALAQVRRVQGRVWVQGALLSDGWARVRSYADNHALVQPLLQDEARARQARRGLWALPVYDVRLPSEVGRGVRGFQIVEGRVAAVSQGRDASFLEFSPDRRGFAAEIPYRVLQGLKAAGVAPDRLANRLIRVRGAVGWDGVMVIDHPEQVEKLSER